MRTAGMPPPLAGELRRHAAPLLVLVVGTVAGLTLGAVTGAGGWPVYAVVVVGGVLLLTALHRRVQFSTVTIWGLVVFALGHLAGGMVPVGDGVLYEQWLVGRVVRYDNVQHAWGFGIAGRAVWESLRRQLTGAPDPRLAVVVVIVLGGAGVGALNETVEYGLTKVLPDTNVGGYENTSRDLIANLVGASTAAAMSVPRRQG
jgi:hypothetical protein